MKPILNGRGPARKARSQAEAMRRPAARSPELSVLIDGDRQFLDAARLADAAAFHALVSRCRQASSVVVTLDGLIDISDGDRLAVLGLAHGVAGASFSVQGVVHADLLEAVLSIEPGPQVGRIGRWKAAALEVAVLAHADVLDVACNRVHVRTKQLKLQAMTTAALLKEASKISRRLQAAGVDPRGPVKIRDVLSDAPVPSGAVVPAGWTLSTSAIARTSDGVPIVVSPVLITQRSIDARRGTHMVTLAFHWDGRWQTLLADRLTIADHFQVVRLAAHGLPVTSVNANQLVEYLAAFEAANLPHLPLVRRTPPQLATEATTG